MHCNDYVSEKFWRNSLTQFMVPIVYGPHPDDVKVDSVVRNSYLLYIFSGWHRHILTFTWRTTTHHTSSRNISIIWIKI